MSLEKNHDGDTWAIHCWDLEKKGFSPARIFADGGTGLRCGHQLAMPHAPCDLDNFHIMQDLTNMRRFFRNRLKTAISCLKQQTHKLNRSKTNGNVHLHVKHHRLALQEEKAALYLSNSIDTLVHWMQHDVLNMPGQPPTERQMLYDFIVAELKQLEGVHPHRIKEVRIMLEDENYLALSFVDVLNERHI